MSGWESVLALQLRLQAAFKQKTVAVTFRPEQGWDPEHVRLMLGAAEEATGLAEPMFVSVDVMDIWDEARVHFAPEPLRPSDLIMPFGFVLLPRPVSLAPQLNPVRAFVWAAIDDGVTIFGFSDAPRTEGVTVNDSRRFTGAEAEEIFKGVFPWTIATVHNLTFDEAGEGSEHRALQAFWRLAQEFVLSREPLPRARRREVQRLTKGVPVNYVTVLRLRRSKRATVNEQHVDWASRWIVRGHWRNQWYPSEKCHRQRYVPAYIKGPSDKPLRVSDRVVEFIR
jgi:hypothetical protein